MSADVFDRYAASYDLLYRDKDYAAETEYVARTLRAAEPKTRTLLEFGSGTGRHGRLLADQGFEVFGIERSKRMVESANANRSPVRSSGSFDCEQGDIGTVKLGRKFDAVIALFHVMSYQTTDDPLRRAFANAAEHLNGGLFLFDVWHGPAVVKQPPEIRTKQIENANTKLIRTATPKLRQENHIVAVCYTIVAESVQNGTNETFQEEHLIRYFFPEEIESLARDAAFTIERSEEFMTGRKPSEETWGVSYLLRKHS